MHAYAHTYTAGDYLPTTTAGEIIGLFWLPASTVLAGYALTMPISVHISEKEVSFFFSITDMQQ